MPAEFVTRAAVDIGSGETRLMVGIVDIFQGRLVDLLHTASYPVELQKNLAVHGQLSEAVTRELIGVLHEIQDAARIFSPLEWRAVGTAVFRRAVNGRRVVDQAQAATGLQIAIISRDQEAAIGFETARQLSRCDANQMISWDVGSGSFQVSALIDGKIISYGAEFAFVAALEMLFQKRKQPFRAGHSPNPIPLKELLDLAVAIQEKLPPVPPWLRMSAKVSIATGGFKSIFAVAKIAAGSSVVSIDHVHLALCRLASQSDEGLEAFPSPADALVRLALLFALMSHTGLKEFRYFSSIGNCEGILCVTNDQGEFR